MEYTANSDEARPHFLSSVCKSGPILVREKHSNTEVGWMKGRVVISEKHSEALSLLKPYQTERRTGAGPFLNLNR